MRYWAEEFLAIRDRYGKRIGIVDQDGTHTIAEVLDHAAGIADRLQNLGFGVGDYIATVFQNSALAAAASYAVSLIGATDVPINPVLSRGDIEHALRLTGAKIILIDEKSPPLPVLSVPVEDVRQIERKPLSRLGWPEVDPDAPSRIVFTSGTTGPAKGAIHTHHSRWTGSILLRASLPFWPDSHNRVLLMTPFSHGSSLLTFAYLAQGASVHLIHGVDPDVVLPLLATGDITEMFAPPTVLAKLTEAAGLPRYAEFKPKLTTILTGTAPLTQTVYRNAVNYFGDIIRVTYGKSEIFNPITILDPQDTAQAYAETESEGLCVGWAASGVRIEIRDENGNVLPQGDIGKIYLHSAHMFTGYITHTGLNMLEPGEFHDTGDVGQIDGRGRLYLVARESDIMKSGGYKISPHEIEHILAHAVQGTEFVVLGYPSDYWGEIVTVVAQCPPADWQDILKTILPNMTSYKRPRLFVEIDDIPRNSIGKISRAQLREWISENFDLVEKPQPAFVAKTTGDQ